MLEDELDLATRNAFVNALPNLPTDTDFETREIAPLAHDLVRFVLAMDRFVDPVRLVTLALEYTGE